MNENKIVPICNKLATKMNADFTDTLLDKEIVFHFPVVCPPKRKKLNGLAVTNQYHNVIFTLFN